MKVVVPDPSCNPAGPGSMLPEDDSYCFHPSKRPYNAFKHNLDEDTVNSPPEKQFTGLEDICGNNMTEKDERVTEVESQGYVTDPSSSTGYGSGLSSDCDDKKCDMDMNKDSIAHSSHINQVNVKNESELESGIDEIGMKVVPPHLTPGGNLLIPALDRWIQRHRSIGCISLRRLISILLDDLGLEIALAIEGASEFEIEAFFATNKERLWRLLKQLLLCYHHARAKMQICSRPKLPTVNTLEDAVHLIMKSERVLVVSGAGISVSCGIPDFRSEGGIYTMLGEYDLPSPESMFDLRYFRCNPVPFFQFVREFLPGKYHPSSTHYFIKLLNQKGKLLRNYTQNIDGLELEAGVSEDCVCQCHGSFSTATCQNGSCGRRVLLSEIEDSIRAQKLPMCEICCDPSGILKPDIVFFGEPLGNIFHEKIKQDRLKADLVIVMGSSLQVAPVSHIMNWIPRETPQILINREMVGMPSRFDVELLGDSDDVVRYLCQCLDQQQQQRSSVSKDGGNSEGHVVVQEASLVSSPLHVVPNQMGCWTLDSVIDDTPCGEVNASIAPPVFEPPNTYLFRNAKPKPPQHEKTHEALFDLDHYGPVDMQALQIFGVINTCDVNISVPSYKATLSIDSAEIGDDTDNVGCGGGSGDGYASDDG